MRLLLTESVRAYRVERAPCCHELDVTMECRLRSSYGQKCGYVPQPYAGLAQPRYFREVTGSISSTIVGTLTYTDLVPEEPAERSGNTSCSYSFSASCENPGGLWTATFAYHTEELGGEEREGTDSGAGDGATESICVGALAAFLGTSGPYAEGFTEYSLPYSFTPASEGAPGGGCIPFGVSASGTESGHVFDFYEYDWEESFSVVGTIELCDEHTIAILMADVDADALASEPSEWDNWADPDIEGSEGSTCCGRRELSNDQTLYYVDFLQIRFNYTPPCAGGVRIHYTVATTINGVEDSTETFTVDNPGDTPINVAVPEIGEESGGKLIAVCVTDVWGEML